MKRFRSSPDNQEEADWRIARTNHEPRHANHRSDEEPVREVDFERVAPRRIRGRTRTTEPNVVTEEVRASSPMLSEAPAQSETLTKIPVVRVRNRVKPQNQSGQRNGTLVRVVKTRVAASGAKEAATGQRPTSTTTEAVAANHRPSNHRTAEETSTVAGANGRRVRVRLVQSSPATNVVRTSTQAAVARASAKREPSRESEDDESNEPNYPEHFKALLKNKKPPSEPVEKRAPPKKFVPSSPPPPIVTTVPSTPPSTSTTSQRTPPTQKKFARPSKLMFPSLSKSSGTNDRENLTEKPVEQSHASAVPRRPQPRFSSKIRNMEALPSSVDKMRVVTTGSDEGLEITSFNGSAVSASRTHRLAAVSIRRTAAPDRMRKRKAQPNPRH